MIKWRFGRNWGKLVDFLRRKCGIIGEMNKRLRRFLPKSRNARVILACFIIAALIAISFFALRAKKPRLQPPDAGTIALKLRQDQIEKLNQDSDADGLRDWEEFLYHADPRKPDTDGDTTQDHEEIKLGRDPAKPNTEKDPKKPNDYFPTSEPLTENKGARETAHANLTADFTRTFLRQPIAQILAGAETNIDTKSIEQYADRLKGRSVLADARRFTTADIHIDNAATKESTVQYLYSIQKIFTVLNARGDNELTIISDALQSHDYGALTLLGTYPDAYQKAINGIRALTAPKDLTDFHLTILNYLTQFKRSTELLQGTERDPIMAVLVINERIKLDDEFSVYLDNSAKKIIAQVQK